MKITIEEIQKRMDERVLILDGATGTYLQQQNLTEEDFRGERFKNHPVPLKGCNDVLCLTQPDIIKSMHRAYIDAGADIIETDSFNCNRFSLSDYALQDYVYEISKAAAQCAKEALGRSGAHILIAGSIGPTNRTLSMSSDVNNPAQRDITFQQLYDTYRDQVNGLLDGGADIMLVETIFDTLNAKVALKAISDIGKERGINIPVMCSGTLSDASGRTLSGQTVEAYVASLSHSTSTGPDHSGAYILSIGLNCGFGAKQLLPWLLRLSEIAPCAVSVHPNAGLPNVMGGYDETPETFAKAAIGPTTTLHARKGEAGAVSIPLGVGLHGCAPFNIYGGCCGTTPAHIKAVAEALKGIKPRPLPGKTTALPHSTLSGLEPLVLDRTTPFINIGERTNVAGSLKFKRLIKEKNYDEALSIARHQVENGAQVIDICMDDGLIDGIEAMTTFLNLIASEPEIARVPVMIDSSKWDILKAGLQCVQGKSIVNSISLKEGEEKFIEKAQYIQSMGAATVVMLFDENGQADSYERKIGVARRAYNILKTIGFPTEDIIFDPNVLAVATGMPEHDDYGRAFIEACRTIHQEMPEVHMSGGISNLSFSFRGNNTIRQAMHSVFLHHAMAAGLDMSIVNPAMTTVYEDIPEPLKSTVEAVILNRPTPTLPAREGDGRDEEMSPAERLIELAQQIKEEEDARKAAATDGAGPSLPHREGQGGSATVPEVSTSVKDRILAAMLKGNTDNISDDTLSAYHEACSATSDNAPLYVIDNYLMPAMEKVGELFGEGKMFLPQVVKSARVMKKAVAVLEPYMSEPSNTSNPSTPSDHSTASPSILIATVKGDVHDIGKNIVAVVTQCNGYKVEDLGVMVETDTIVDTAQKHNAAVICLSGLITPSLDEMIKVCQELQRRGMTTPVIVGGATTSALHTAVKMAPEYPNGVVLHSHAAADNATILRRLMADDHEEYIAEQKSQQRIIRENYLNGQSDKPKKLTIEEARKRRHIKGVGEIAVPTVEAMQPLNIEVKISQVKELINWNFFYQAWGLKGDKRTDADAQKLLADAQQMLREMEVQGTVKLSVMAEIMKAENGSEDTILISNSLGETESFTFPRSLDDEPETRCLADYVAEGADYLCPFVVTAGIGLKELQEHYKAQGDEYRAIMAKLLCDRLAEALAEYCEKRVGWGTSSIRFAFGYGACPDHNMKQKVFNLLHVQEHLPLSLTETFMINPGESICGLIFANTPTKYFNA
ncbi:MAG: methionine synthase [Prevotella sp.]|nr:methionine synthase [Candidatus Prevotella equi]